MGPVGPLHSPGVAGASSGDPPHTAPGSPGHQPPDAPAGDAPAGTGPKKKIPAVPVTAIGQFVVTTRSGPRTPPRICRGCGLALADFRQTGVLGCAECYESFAEQLEGLIARSHAGATHHTGRKPRRSADAAERQDRVRRLLRELHEAVSSEQFERAARLRDELRVLNVDPAARTAESN